MRRRAVTDTDGDPGTLMDGGSPRRGVSVARWRGPTQKSTSCGCTGCGISLTRILRIGEEAADKDNALIIRQGSVL